MRPAFFDRMHVRIIDVLHRDRTYAAAMGHTIRSQSTKIRSFLYAYEGRGTMEIDGVLYPLSAGCAFHFPMGQSLVIRSSPEAPLCYYTVRHDYKLLEWEGTSVHCFEPEDAVLPFDFVVPMPDEAAMLNDVRELYDVWHRREPDYEWDCKLAFLNILQRVSRQQRRRSEQQVPARCIQQSMDYIRDHYSEPLDREALARQASLSASYFSVLFKKYTGYSPVRYITKIRLDHAKLLLRERHLSIAEVAREVGFQDPLYFAKVFAHEIGVPPREYRKI